MNDESYDPLQSSPGAIQPMPIHGPQARVDLNSTGMTTTYTNLFRVTGTFEELIVDFGLHSGLITANGPEAVKISNRMVMSFPTAKRLLAALQLALSRHEQVFGSVETDPQRRAKK
jgi:hypothetical protein